MKSANANKNLLVSIAACGLVVLMSLDVLGNGPLDRIRSASPLALRDGFQLRNEIGRQPDRDVNSPLLDSLSHQERISTVPQATAKDTTCDTLCHNRCVCYYVPHGLTVPAVGTIQAEPNQLAKSGQEQRMVAIMSHTPRTAETNVTGRLPHDRFFHPARTIYAINCDWFQPDFEAGDRVVFEVMRNPTLEDLTIGRMYAVQTNTESDCYMGRLRRIAGGYFWLEWGFRMRTPFSLADLEEIAVAVERRVDLNKKADASAREDATLLAGRGIDTGEEVTGPITEG